MNRDLLEKIATYVAGTFSEKLSEDIYYHNIAHTKNVVQQALAIGKLSSIPENELTLLETAAWFHDLGFIKKAEGHEEVSAELASNFLKNEGVSDQEIEIIERLIFATKIDIEPKTILEQVLVDADVSYLGGTDYFETANALRKEWEAQNGKQMSTAEWYKLNIAFFEKQHFYTEAAQGLYSKQKAENLSQINAALVKN